MAGDRVRYICPICDHEMKFGRHYCRNCKSRVDEPWPYTGGHLPNEGHNSSCPPSQTYMNPRTPQNQDIHGGKSLAGKNNVGKQYTYNRPAQSGTSAGRMASGNRTGTSYGGSSGSNDRSGSTNTPRKKNTGCGGLLFILIVYRILMQMLFGLAS